MVVLFPTPQTPCLSQKPEIIAPSVIIKALNKLHEISFLFIAFTSFKLSFSLLISFCYIKKAPKGAFLKMGRIVGFEPTHIGTTIRGLNHLTTPAIYPRYFSIVTQTIFKSRVFIKKVRHF